MFGLLVCAVAFCILSIGDAHSPSTVFYPLLLFMAEFPDLDHLFWLKIKLRYVVPFTIWDIFRWNLRTEYNPLSFLHYWIYPFILLALLAIPFKSKGLRWIILAVFLGWTTHLLLDGVIYFV